jgi:hypothetical protein
MKKSKPSAGKGLFRDGGKLVFREGARFPDRCVNCDKPCDGEVVAFVFERRKSHYIDVAAVQTVANAAVDLVKGGRYTGPVHAAIPLCPWHRKRRWRHIGVGAGLMALVGAYLLIRYAIGGAREFEPSQMSIYTWVALFMAVLGLGIVSAASYDPTNLWFKVSKFHDRLVWIQGAGREFLNTLPYFEGARDLPGRGNYTRDDDEANLSAEELIRRAKLHDVE